MRVFAISCLVSFIFGGYLRQRRLFCERRLATKRASNLRAVSRDHAPETCMGRTGVGRRPATRTRAITLAVVGPLGSRQTFLLAASTLLSARYQSVHHCQTLPAVCPPVSLKQQRRTRTSDNRMILLTLDTASRTFRMSPTCAWNPTPPN